MCQKIIQKIEVLSDTDLLGVLVGSRHAALLLKDASGSLSQLLHEPMPVAYAHAPGHVQAPGSR